MDLENRRDVKPLTDSDDDHADLKVKGIAGKGSNRLSVSSIFFYLHTG